MAAIEEADILIHELRGKGFSLRLKDGKLLATPLSKLSQQQRQAISRIREEIIALLEWEELDSPATDTTLRAWYTTMDTALASTQRLSQTLPRRIVLLASDGVSIDRVLCEPSAAGVVAELRRLRGEWPGRTLAAEWQQGNRWLRWITTTEATEAEGPITTTGEPRR